MEGIKTSGETRTARRRDGQSQRRHKAVGIIIMVVAVAAVLAVLAYLGVLGSQTPPSAVIAAGDMLPITSNAQVGGLPGIAELDAQMQQLADSTQFSYKINARPVVTDGTANLAIENPRYNAYPMVVQVILDGSGDMIYDSGAIQPNHHTGSKAVAYAAHGRICRHCHYHHV